MDNHVSAKHISVLGAGSWGTALAMHLARHHPQVTLWAKDPNQAKELQLTRRNAHYLPMATLPDNLTVTDDLASAMKDCQLLFLVVPSHAFESCLEQIAPFCHPQLTLVWATKGVLANGDLLHSAVEKKLGNNLSKAMIAGPSFATEVAAELPTAIVVASDQTSAAMQVAKVLSSPRFRVYISNDMIGAQLGGAVKNVLAIATGISDGLGFGANARSALITRGLAELMRLGSAMGAQTETLMGLAGLGDLILTCTDDKSRNRRFGLSLGRGESAAEAMSRIGQVVEGAQAATYVYHLAQRYQIDMPITEQVYRVLNEDYSPEIAVNVLLSRRSGTE